MFFFLSNKQLLPSLHKHQIILFIAHDSRAGQSGTLASSHGGFLSAAIIYCPAALIN